MEKIKLFFRGRLGGFVLCAVQILVGVLLLADWERFTSAIIIGAGVLMMLTGAVQAIRYFLTRPEEAAKRQLLFRGLILLMAGLFCAREYARFSKAFELLALFYAGVMLVLAAMKLQQMSDMLRLKRGRWYMPAISAAIAAALAVIILLNPFGAANAVWVFAGISLIAEAAVELAGAILR